MDDPEPECFHECDEDDGLLTASGHGFEIRLESVKMGWRSSSSSRSVARRRRRTTLLNTGMMKKSSSWTKIWATDRKGLWSEGQGTDGDCQRTMGSKQSTTPESESNKKEKWVEKQRSCMKLHEWKRGDVAQEFKREPSVCSRSHEGQCRIEKNVSDNGWQSLVKRRSSWRREGCKKRTCGSASEEMRLRGISLMRGRTLRMKRCGICLNVMTPRARTWCTTGMRPNFGQTTRVDRRNW